MFLDEARVLAEIREHGARAAYRRLLAGNDALIAAPDLDSGRIITTSRTAIHTGLVGAWADEQHRTLGYDKPFAVAALGGTGRAEMVPHSDSDFALLFDDTLEGNRFLLELQRQLLATDEFEDRHGFAWQALPFSLDAVPELADKQLNSFLDMRPVYDPQGLTDVFRERIRATFDSFEHFLHVRSFWKDQWERAASESERVDRFDIKNEGLRLFLAGIWTLAGHDFVHSHEIYRQLEDPRDLEAYDFLLRIRAFVHLRRGPVAQPALLGNHPEDVLTFDDFLAFGELLGPGADEQARFECANAVRGRLLSARRRVARFAKIVIERELKYGRAVSPGSSMQFGVGGLSDRKWRAGGTPREKSRAALALLLASQHYGVRVDPSELASTFRNAGDWLVHVPELSALFYEQRGSLADSFAFLSQIDGAEDRLFPGHARFESSLDGRLMSEGQFLRGALARRKIVALEGFVRGGRAQLAAAVSPERLTDLTHEVSAEVEAALLDADHLAAVKLALKTKRLPMTPADQDIRADATRPLYDRFSTGLSDIPLADYYEPFRTGGDFPAETIAIVEFLVANRRAFKEFVRDGLNDARKVDVFVGLCGDEQRLRALFTFTCADRFEWESEDHDPTRWFNMRELYAKAIMRFRPRADPARSLDTAGYAPEDLLVLRDFGEDFFTGVYRRYANRFGPHFLRLIDAPAATGPKAAVIRDGGSVMVGVAARDHPGLAASITGAFWDRGIALRQAHLFCASRHALALDFFHLAPSEKPLPPDLVRSIEDAIRHQRYIEPADESRLPRIGGATSLREWRPGVFRLRFEPSEDAPGIIYALTYKVFTRLRGNIFGLTAHPARGRAYISVYHSLPPDLSLEQARAIAEGFFAP